MQVTQAPSSGGGSGSPAPSPSSSTSPAPTQKIVGADIHIKTKGIDTTYTGQKVDAKLPPGSPAFKITKIAEAGVTFTLLNGFTLGGDSTGAADFTVPVAARRHR